MPWKGTTPFVCPGWFAFAAVTTTGAGNPPGRIVVQPVIVLGAVNEPYSSVQPPNAPVSKLPFTNPATAGCATRRSSAMTPIRLRRTMPSRALSNRIESVQRDALRSDEVMCAPGVVSGFASVSHDSIASVRGGPNVVSKRAEKKFPTLRQYARPASVPTQEFSQLWGHFAMRAFMCRAADRSATQVNKAQHETERSESVSCWLTLRVVACAQPSQANACDCYCTSLG